MKEKTAEKVQEKRLHKATYSSDKKNGGYLVRVQGPNASMFVNREVSVTLKNGSEHSEKLTKLVWSGVDTVSGQPVALYKFASKPKDPIEEVKF